MPTELSQKEKKQLRGRAQQIKATLHLGKEGLTDTFLAELHRALLRESLVKVKFAGDRELVKEAVAAIEDAASCVCVAKVGFTATFYREKMAEPGKEPAA